MFMHPHLSEMFRVKCIVDLALERHDELTLTKHHRPTVPWNRGPYMGLSPKHTGHQYTSQRMVGQGTTCLVLVPVFDLDSTWFHMLQLPKICLAIDLAQQAAAVKWPPYHKWAAMQQRFRKLRLDVYFDVSICCMTSNYSAGSAVLLSCSRKHFLCWLAPGRNWKRDLCRSHLLVAVWQLR